MQKRRKRLAFLLQQMPTVVKKIRSFLYSSKLVWSLLSLSFNPLLDFHFHFCFFLIKSVLTVFSLCRQRVPSNVFIFLIHFFRCSFSSILSPGAFPSATVSVQFEFVILTIVHTRNMQWVYYPLFWHHELGDFHFSRIYTYLHSR